MNRRRISAVIALIALGLCACDPQPKPQAPSGIAWQKPLTGPTGLRILIDNRLVDADNGTVVPREIWERLSPVDGAPIFIVRSDTQRVGAARVEAGAVDLPGSPPILLVTGSYFDLAASTDGKSIWISEYLSQTHCTLRELWLDGRAKRAAREVPCGVTPVAQTDAGLWIAKWDNWFTMDHNFTEFTERKRTYALVDPQTLAERANHAEARILGREHILTLDDQESNLVLRTAGGAVNLEKPSPHTEYVFNGHRPVVPVSPDGRYALFRFGSHSESPQIIDVWVLDLRKAAWLHVPGMPAKGALKYSSEAWAPDGRLVLVGQFGLGEPIFGTWRPGDAQVAVLAQNPVPREAFKDGFGPISVWLA